MNKLFATKIWQSLWATLLFVLLTTTSANASGWELDGYYWSGSADTVGVLKSQSQQTGSNKFYSGKTQATARNRRAESFSPILPTYAYIATSNGTPSDGTVGKDSLGENTAKVGSSVYAVFVWRRNQQTYYDADSGQYVTSTDPNDNPPSHVYVREEGSVFGGAGTHSRYNNYDPFAHPWQNKYEITGTVMGEDLGEAYRPENFPKAAWWYKEGHKIVIRKIAVSGDSAVVPSRSFQGEVKLLSSYETDDSDPDTSASLDFEYQAEAVNFSLNASAPAVSDRQQTKPNAEEIDALVGLRWLHPENIGAGDENEDAIKPSRSDARRYWDGFFGDGQIDDGAPIPYFAGQATFTVTATRSDGRTPIFNGQTYKWTPEDNSDPFDPDGNGTPGFVASSDTERTYVWNFGSAQEGDGNFPQTTDVTVEVSSADDDGETLEETKTINWHSTWSPTETGLQKNIVTSKFGRYVRPDGSPVAISDVKPGDTILCFVEGDPGFSTDGNRLEKIRPVPHEHQVPGPGERIEPRVVGQIVPSGDNDQIIIFNSKPQVNPDDNPDAAGFDEIQQTREIAAATEQTYQTGKVLVKGALEIQFELMKAAATGPAEVLALQSAIKGVMAVGRYAEAAKQLRAGIKAVEKGATDARAAARAAEALKARGGLSAGQVARVEKDIAYFNRRAADCDQIVKDSKSAIKVGEKYSAETLARIKNANPSGSWKVEGRFVAEDIEKRILNTAGVYASNPTAKPISEALNAQGKIISKSASGEFMYVLTKEGKLVMGTRNKLAGEPAGRFSHPTLIGGKDPEVLAAGMFRLRAGKVEWVDNASGHFQPNDKSLVAVADAFMKLPANARGSQFKVIRWNDPH